MVKDQNGNTDAARTKLEFYAHQTAINSTWEELTMAYEKTIQELLIRIDELDRELKKDNSKEDKKKDK